MLLSSLTEILLPRVRPKGVPRTLNTPTGACTHRTYAPALVRQALKPAPLAAPVIIHISLGNYHPTQKKNFRLLPTWAVCEIWMHDSQMAKSPSL